MTDTLALQGFAPRLSRDWTPEAGESQKRVGEATGREHKATCLCVAEGHSGLQDVGHYVDGVYVLTGEITCRICDGTGISPRARGERVKE